MGMNARLGFVRLLAGLEGSAAEAKDATKQSG
jgi:hypothetical protein